MTCQDRLPSQFFSISHASHKKKCKIKVKPRRKVRPLGRTLNPEQIPITYGELLKGAKERTRQRQSPVFSALGLLVSSLRLGDISPAPSSSFRRHQAPPGSQETKGHRRSNQPSTILLEADAVPKPLSHVPSNSSQQCLYWDHYSKSVYSKK